MKTGTSNPGDAQDEVMGDLELLANEDHLDQKIELASQPEQQEPNSTEHMHRGDAQQLNNEVWDGEQFEKSADLCFQAKQQDELKREQEPRASSHQEQGELEGDCPHYHSGKQPDTQLELQFQQQISTAIVVALEELPGRGNSLSKQSFESQSAGGNAAETILIEKDPSEKHSLEQRHHSSKHTSPKRLALQQQKEQPRRRRHESMDGSALSPPSPVIPLNLKPFVHQVGGSYGMLCLDRDTLCKALGPREHAFYKSLQGPITGFTAKYLGSVEVECRRDVAGQDCLYVGYFNKELLRRLKPSLDPSSLPKPETTVSEVGQHKGSCNDTELHSPAKRREVIGIQYEDPKAKLVVEGHLTNRLMHLFKKEGKSRKRFMMLENIIAGFRHPCVLDLKMGTRQHGDEENRSKSDRKAERCVNTTSAKLGLRVGGMQVYQRKTGKYLIRDKYWGRKQDIEGVSACLMTFLSNGDGEVRRDLLSPFLTELDEFHSILLTHDSYRFYSSSLLLIYDGADTVLPDQNQDKVIHQPDPQEVTSTLDDHGDQTRKDTNEIDVDKAAESSTIFDGAEKRAIPLHHGVCSVRMCDFAHSTFKGFGTDRLVHKGPDAGYLLGVENLAQILKNIRAQQL